MSIRVGELLKNLKVFNASNNDIKNIYASDLSVSSYFECLKAVLIINYFIIADHEEPQGLWLEEQSIGM